MELRILLAEDVQMVRGALVALIELEHDMTVVADVSNGSEIVPVALRVRPDVAVIDIDLPGFDGLTAAARLHEQLPSCRTLILTSLDRPGTLRRALATNVGGYLLKDAPPSELASAVRRVAAGQRVIDSDLALAAWHALDAPLTPREVEVLRHAASGAVPSEIALTLNLSVGTVRNYLASIVMKLGARNRIDAIRLATEAGWIP
ncbi:MULTISPECIES: response regulator transcription factor [Streptomyces]|uniref:DNA-binding response regulator n=2 Tax=Streptomyces TaxID=1883 RepID=A0ABV9IHQ5_9ACTN